VHQSVQDFCQREFHYHGAIINSTCTEYMDKISAENIPDCSASGPLVKRGFKHLLSPIWLGSDTNATEILMLSIVINDSIEFHCHNASFFIGDSELHQICKFALPSSSGLLAAHVLTDWWSQTKNTL
jgi:hypothetical protein